MSARNVIITEQTSCLGCKYYSYYFPTDDSFDEDRVGYCTKTTRKGDKNEVGYGRRTEDFPIPDWCPILLEQNNKSLSEVEKEEKLKEKERLRQEGEKEFNSLMNEMKDWPDEKRKAFLDKLNNKKGF